MFADNNIHTVPFPGLGVKALNKMPSLQSLHDGMDESNYYQEDEIPLLDDSNARKGRGTEKGIYDVKGWDVFRALPPGSERSGSVRCWEITTQILKIVMYFITFVVVLGCAVTSKGSLLFMTSQIKLNRNINLCKADNGKSGDSTTTATINTSVTISWIWGIFFAFCMSEIFTFFACLRQVLFKRIMTPRPSIFFTVLLMETLHTVGVCLFLYEVLPSLDAVRGAMLTNCLCFIPACLNLLSRPRSESHRFIKTVVDILAIMAQANGFILIPLVQPVNKPWAIPLSLILTSIGWWENYVDRNSAFPFIQSIALYKDDLKKSRYKTYMFVSLWKCIVMFGAMIGFLAMDMPNVGELFPSKNPFGPQSFNVKKITNITGTIGEVPSIQKTHGYESLIVCSVQIISSFICYYAGKFACRICIQGFSFAFPLNLVMPVTVSLLIALCGLKAEDSCFFTSIIPDYIYWECFRGDVIKNLVAQEHAWVWLLWLFSQTWITLHIWSPKCERLAKTEKLFVLPMYHGLFIDQSMVLNRRRDDEAEVRTEDIDLNKQEGIVPEDVSAFYETISVDTEASSKESKIHKHPDTLTKIYCCATMWHETSSEMQQMLKSVMRMDEDQSARRNAQQYLRVVDPDYYEFEVHIFFDDAFEISDENEDENQVNDFVKQLINVMDTAASAVHQCNLRLRPPKKVPTPYGGRLIWILPGKNKLTAHLKDKSKIRHRKRWSQVMYMYYLLGNRLMELPIDVNRKEVLAENTFILTLDGDIDFRPHAVQLLVDLMKKNHNLGATCGRIHPIGSGPMVWYQKFEYAIGHWLQKATEHMIGCVLCSPGCFSLFRAKALMDDNCMRRYTLKSEEARHYVQFDQGEDRWLCTLLLQRGYRVEYCAASDAYTHAPEGFVEFYNQRRRWVPSTIANIMDLLMDYKTTIKVNDNISFGYILYQMALMLGTLLGPGTIFLMIVGACVAAFRISNWTSFMGNISPILLFMIICFLCKAEIQLIFAQILSAGYAMLMMAVIVGTTLQMNEDGTGSPSAIFMFTLIGSFLIAALLHPQEFFCIVHGLLYFLSIPSMYLLLMIYSLCNLNNVTWGTREVQTKKTREELQEEKKREEELKKAQRANLLFGLLGNKNSEEKNDGFLSFGCGNLFRCLLCVDSRKDGDRAELIRINAGIEELGKKIEKLENKLRPAPDEWENHGHKIHPREKIREQMRSEPIENHYEELPNERHHSRDFDDLKSIRDDLINPFWIEDKALRRGEVEYLPPMEIQFWKDLIAKYLHPLDENKEHKARIAKDLKDLRNKCTFGFFMFNGLFILIVFLLQLNKDTLHIDWPFGAKINTTFNEETGAIDHQEITPLHLEPIGLVFVVFFMLILVIQFIAMIFHRFGTLSHILATTELSCFKSKITDFGDNAFIEKNAVEIARNLQALRGLDDDYHVLDYDFSPNGVALRRTIHHLEKYGKGKPKTGTLDVAFKKRFFALTAENGPIEANTPVRLRRNLTLRAETIRAIERRRNTVFGNKANRMETLGANGHVPGMKTGKGRRRLDSVFQPDSDGFQGYHNETYDRAGSESNLINSDGMNMKTVAPSPHPADSWEQNDLNENITNSVL